MSRDRSDGGGFVCTWRSLRESPLWFTQRQRNRSASPIEAFLDLLMDAAYEDHQVSSHGETIMLRRGQVLTSVLRLSRHWKWSQTKVLKFFRSARNREEIAVKSERLRTVVTIINYDKWQIPPDRNRDRNRESIEEKARTERDVEGIKQSEEVTKRTIGRSSEGVSLGTRNRAEASEDRRNATRSLLVRCQRHAERLVGFRFTPAVGKVFDDLDSLRTTRDDETIEEVFEHFVSTRTDRSTLNFHSFVTWYSQHERSTIKAVREEKARGKALQAHRAGSNANGTETQ